MKKLFCILLIIPIILFNSGCNIIAKTVFNVLSTYKYSYIDDILEKQTPTPQPQQPQSNHKAITYKSYYGYNELNEQEKAIYEQLSNSVNNYWNLLDLRDNPLSVNGFQKILCYFIDDNPECFWLSNEYNYIYNSDQTAIVAALLRYQDKNKTDSYKADSYELETLANRDEISEMRVSFINQTATILDSISEQSDLISKEFEVYKYLGNNIKYDDELAKQIDNKTVLRPVLQSAYGAMVEKDTVCSGFAKAFQYLTNQLGIECLSAFGSFNNDDHQWNIIKIGDNYYHVDPTASKIDFKDKTFYNYRYFNATDDEILKTHTTKYYEFKYTLPLCNNNAYSHSNLFVPEIDSKNPNSISYIKDYIDRYSYYKMNSMQIKFPDGYSFKKVQNWVDTNYNNIKSYTEKYFKLGKYYYYDEENFILYMELIKK